MFSHRFEKKPQGECLSLADAALEPDFQERYLSEYFDDLRSICTDGRSVGRVRIVKIEGREKEHYTVSVGEEIVISAVAFSGALYALADLKDMALSRNGLRACTFAGEPICSFRAYRAYLPSREGKEDFFRSMRFLTDFKYNTVILEAGGAMEYERHPEINRAWSRFMEDVRRYSGRSLEIQCGYPWEKDSIHAENADGEVLTKKETEEIVSRLKRMGLEVIPEVPLLSHADYICLAHPELAERKEDPYPDTYCPSNEGTYEIVFDILEEVIGVFQPRLINIGHDEFYSVALCDRCKEKDPVDLYVGDIVKIHNWLKKRGIRTMMWGEKLLDARRGEERIGGAGVDRINEAGYHVTVPPLWRCAEKLPKDILMINWYWEFGAHLDQTYIKNGYSFVYGNLCCDEIDGWNERLKRGPLGGAVSNWGAFDRKSMQRNLQIYSLAASACLFWEGEAQDLSVRRNQIAESLYARRLAEIPKNSRVEIVSSADRGEAHRFFWCGEFAENEGELGKFCLLFEDGTEAEYPAVNGENTGSADTVSGSREWAQTLYMCLPEQSDGEMRFRTVFCNPCPEKRIKGIVFEPLGGCKTRLIYKIL